MKLIRRTMMSGVTLVEILLVMVIVSAIVYMGIGYVQQRALNLRIDRTAAQMQQILNAAMVYYVNHGEWPADVACLQGGAAAPCDVTYIQSPLYIPLSPGSQYGAYVSGTNFIVYAAVTASQPGSYAEAMAVVGKLPLGYATVAGGVPGSCTPTSTTCYAEGYVTVPGQNLNNATSVNFAGVYHNGACVPVPSCPVDSQSATLLPEIMVVPTSVMGANDEPTYNATNCNPQDTSGCSVSAYPLTSFTASTTGGTDSQPPSCSTGAAQDCYESYDVSGAAGPTMSGTFWRVCLNVVTEKGEVVPSSNAQGQLTGSVMAITKCRMQDEPQSSDFSVYTQ